MNEWVNETVVLVTSLWKGKKVSRKKAQLSFVPFTTLLSILTSKDLSFGIINIKWRIIHDDGSCLAFGPHFHWLPTACSETALKLLSGPKLGSIDREDQFQVGAAPVRSSSHRALIASNLTFFCSVGHGTAFIFRSRDAHFRPLSRWGSRAVPVQRPSNQPVHSAIMSRCQCYSINNLCKYMHGAIGF